MFSPRTFAKTFSRHFFPRNISWRNTVGYVSGTVDGGEKEDDSFFSWAFLLEYMCWYLVLCKTYQASDAAPEKWDGDNWRAGYLVSRSYARYKVCTSASQWLLENSTWYLVPRLWYSRTYVLLVELPWEARAIDARSMTPSTPICNNIGPYLNG